MGNRSVPKLKTLYQKPTLTLLPITAEVKQATWLFCSGALTDSGATGGCPAGCVLFPECSLYSWQTYVQFLKELLTEARPEYRSAISRTSDITDLAHVNPQRAPKRRLKILTTIASVKTMRSPKAGRRTLQYSHNY